MWERESLWFTKLESLTLKMLLLSEDIISAGSIIPSMKELIFSSLCRWPICSSGHSCSSQMKETHLAFSSQSTDRFHHQTFSSRTTKTSNFLCTGLERNMSWCNEWAVYSFRPVWSLFGPFKPQCGLLNSIVLYKTPVFICTLFIPAWSKIIRPGNFL